MTGSNHLRRPGLERKGGVSPLAPRSLSSRADHVRSWRPYCDSTAVTPPAPISSVDPDRLTCGVRVLTVFPSPPLPKGASNSGVPAPGERRSRGRPRSGPERPCPPHTSFDVSIRPPLDKSSDRPPEDRDKSSAADLSKERWERHGLPRGTTDGVTCPPAGSFVLHRGHRAGVVPALAYVLLVRRVTGVLAAVVAAELLALLGLAPAPHVLAVHPDLLLQSGSPTVDLPSWRTLYASRALCQPLRIHRIGPLVCSPATTSEPTGVPASTRGTSHPALLVHRRSDHEPAPPGNRPASARPVGMSRSKKNARACQSPSGGEPRIDLDLIRRAEAEGLPETCGEALTSAGGVLMSRRDDPGVLPPCNEGRWALRAYRRPQLASALLG